MPIRVNENKLTRTISYNHKALITFHHVASNTQVPGFNFLDFLVNDLSTKSHAESYMCVKVALPLQKFPRFSYL